MSYTLDGDKDKRAAAVAAVMKIMNTDGFMRLENVQDYDQEEIFKAVKAFHYDISLEDRKFLGLKHFNSNNSNRLHGFFPFIDNDPSHKEFYDMSN